MWSCSFWESSLVFWRGKGLESGQGNRPQKTQPAGAQGYKVKREVCWGVSAARLERGGGYTKQEAGRTSHEFPQGRGIFYKMQRQWKSSTEERKGDGKG